MNKLPFTVNPSLATRNGLRAICAVTLALLWLASGCGRQTDDGDPVTFKSMLPALTNRAAMAMPPLPGRMRMVSSYDRTGGNNDWLQNLRPDADGLVTLAEIDGPGCVVRIWMTGYRYQDLRFYIDGEREPRIQRAPRDLFGGDPPFSYPLSGIVSGGSYSYVPIPFAKSLVIKGKWPDIGPDSRPYLHVNYFEFPARTPVVSFPHELSPAQLEAVAAVNRQWKPLSNTIDDNPEVAGVGPTPAPGSPPPGSEDQLDQHGNEAKLLDALVKATAVTIAPGETHAWLDTSGEGMIEGFAISIDFDDTDDAVRRKHALRELALHIHWDGRPEPSVAAPLGDFFGNALAWRSWRSMFAGQIDGVFISQWPMPYQHGAMGTLRNDGSTPLRVRTAHRTTARPPQARYFHARWHQAIGQGVPYPVLYTEGSGHYVGCYLVSFSSDGDWNILEGDESFQVDDEPWPSIHGTGLEDYFNGAWYYTGIFDLPVHGLLEKAVMRTTQYRWHPSDPVPFDQRLSLQFEFGHGNTSQGYMASVAYWYQDQPRTWSGLSENPRRKPPDPLERMVLMSEVFELERIGHWREAAERCEIYAALMNHPEITDLMRVRAAAYATLEGDSNAVTKHLKESGMPEHPAIAQQAQLLAMVEQNMDMGLLGVQCRGNFRVFLNGELIGEGNTPNSMSVWPVDLPDGEHELTVEVTPDQRMPFLSLALRWKNMFIRTDEEWQISRVRPVEWPKTTDPYITWSAAAPAMTGVAMLPRMDCWQLNVNAFVNMQSAKQIHFLRQIWDENPRLTMYFRRQFVKDSTE